MPNALRFFAPHSPLLPPTKIEEFYSKTWTTLFALQSFVTGFRRFHRAFQELTGNLKLKTFEIERAGFTMEEVSSSRQKLDLENTPLGEDEQSGELMGGKKRSSRWCFLGIATVLEMKDGEHILNYYRKQYIYIFIQKAMFCVILTCWTSVWVTDMEEEKNAHTHTLTLWRHVTWIFQVMSGVNP